VPGKKIWVRKGGWREEIPNTISNNTFLLALITAWPLLSSVINLSNCLPSWGNISV
jgi:hypothetical protein